MKRKRVVSIAIIAVAIIIIIISFTGKSSVNDNEMIVSVDQGEFIVDIITSGELEAKSSVNINGPSGLRRYRIYNVTIQDIIDEGSYVRKGQYIARLDPSELTTKISDAQLELDKEQSQHTQTRLDTSLTMRQARDELINLAYSVREKQLTLDQSQFEPPATIQKAEIELEKARRTLQQAEENYLIRRDQNIAKMQEVAANLRKAKNEFNGMEKLVSTFMITAPEDGMLIYHKGHDGKPLKEGSQISAWDPIVATLPDLSKMISKTYVNEVDIRKIKAGQKVDIGFDAFPDKQLKGEVIKVANVGEQRPNSDSKVFQVEIEIFGSDELLRPGMTTSNRIITKQIASGVFVPLECLHSQFDSITYVYKKEGLRTIKQEVILGDANSNEVIIVKGVEKGERVHLSNVHGLENDEFILLPEMDGKRNKKAEEVDTPVQQPQNSQRKMGSRGDKKKPS